MFFDLDLRGDSLPPKTLCLTYDDGPGQTEGAGPGPKTAEIGQYLAEQGIAAAFFVLGQHVRSHPGIIARLRAGGHLVANHTDTHPTLVSFVRDGGDVEAELARADEAIGSPSQLGDLTYFRAPYGNWRDDHDPADHDAEVATSAVARVLNEGGRFPHMVGPVGWDIDARDWNCWRIGAGAEECGQHYLDAVEQQGRGIILLHDSSETPALRDGNLAFELTCWLVPRLRERGYQFVRLDRVPGVVSATRVTRQVSFATADGRHLTSPAASSAVRLTAGQCQPAGRERFGIVPLGRADGGELVGLRAANGCYLARGDGEALAASATRIDESAQWVLATDPTGRCTLRSSRGESVGLAADAAAVLVRADADPIRFALHTSVAVPPLGEKEG